MSRLLAFAAVLVATPVFAQVAAPITTPPPKPTLAQIGLFIYPAQNQTPEQQKLDEDACFEWAEANTGMTMVAGQVDAAAAGKAAAGKAGGGAVVGGAAGGAAVGLGIGAITGHAGKGAAIGAIAGSMGGLAARSSAKQKAGQAGAAQAVQANQEAVDKFKKAAGVCLEGRGYSVK